ncbi:MAG: hypothetical protein ACLFR0_03040 [Alphaproteobacteria bacterium]
MSALDQESQDERIAGAYAFRQIYVILNHIGAASNPATPREIAGRVYERLNDFAGQIDDIVAKGQIEEASPELKQNFRQMAIAHLRDIYADLSHCDDLNEQEKEWLSMLEISHDIMEEVINGEFEFSADHQRGVDTSFKPEP